MALVHLQTKLKVKHFMTLLIANNIDENLMASIHSDLSDLNQIFVEKLIAIDSASKEYQQLSKLSHDIRCNLLNARTSLRDLINDLVASFQCISKDDAAYKFVNDTMSQLINMLSGKELKYTYI